MVNELQSQEWAYLLDPCFQLLNTNGKPLTNGHIEVFYHGTRTPYYCASDWNGTLHPFKIKIDALGSSVVLADPKFSYDVYVYNVYGGLVMSRYNVNPGTGGSGGSSSSDGEAPHWTSDPNGGASSSVTGGTTVYLTLPSSQDQPEFVDHSTSTAIFLKGGLYHIDAVVSFKQDDDDLENIIKDLVVNTGLIGWDAQMTCQKNWSGPESTDDDRHFLELHTVVSVPEDLLQTLYFQISSPVDLDSASVMKLDIVKLTAGGGGMTYAPGYGIDITGQVISTSGMMPESAADNFVNVSSYNIDIQNIYETIAETSAMIPSGVATEQWVTDYTSAFITEDALEGYATQQWVEDQHYITSADIPPIPQDVVTSGELATVSGDIVSQIPSLDGYATQNWVQDQGYLTSVPEEYVTQTEMENYVESETSSFITSADLPSLDGYATEQYVQDYTSAFITSADVPHFTQEQADWNEDDPSAPDYIKNKPTIPSLEGYATEQYVQDYTSAFITSADIPDVPEDLVTSAELATVSGDIVSRIPSLDGYATEQWVGEQGYLTSIPEDLVTSAELASVSGDIVSQIPDVSDMATQTWVNEQGYLTSIPAEYATSGDLATVSGDIMNEIPDTSDMATKTWVGQQGYLTSIPAEYATSGDLVTLSGAIEADIPSYTAGDNISIVSDTISVSGTAGLIAGDNVTITASGDNYVISSTGGGVSQIYTDSTITGDGTQADPFSVASADNWTQAYDAINASASTWNDAAGMNEYPISAGPGMSIEDVSGVTVFQTSGTMMDDLIEYNSQDEISGYNGHPVMTVDSEKQWLNHDDTIAHVTNSAQYAFGVNVPVVAQAMGTDETVLYSGPNVAPSSTAIALSGNINDFNSVKFYWNANNYVGDIVDEVQCDNNTTQLTFMHPAGASNLWIQFLAMNCPTGVNKNSLTLLAAKQMNFGSWSSTTWSNPTVNTNVGDTFMLSKVVGIGRKENT